MTDLAAQIFAALDRAEETAQAATPGPWGVDAEGVVRSHDAIPGSGVGWTVAETWTHPDENAAHIAANDPAHVLRLTAALREVVKLHAPEDGTDYCPGCIDRFPFHSEDPDAMHPYPCPTLAAVAAMFAEPGEGS